MIEKIQKMVEEMTLEEKVSMCSGKNFWHLQDIPRLELPQIMVSDGPHGLRKQALGENDQVGLNASIPATCFPTAVTLASSWDVHLIHEVGVALGRECLKEEVSILLGPGCNIKRSPLCGRNFEYFSEDPLLSGAMATAWIEGVQSQGIGVSLKHFVANNQESTRMIVDTNVDERALREIYLASFEMPVKVAKPWTLMCSYNKINGTYASENPYLLTDVLRDDWGYEGAVITDWGANNHRPDGLKAGLDIEMPGNGGVNDRVVLEAIKSGELDEVELDKVIYKTLTLIDRANNNKTPDFECNMEAHHNLAMRALAESCVLLKNDKRVLPINGKTHIALIGGFVKHVRYQGAGSSMINPTKVDQPYERGSAIFGDHLVYAKGYDVNNDLLDQQLIDEAVEITKSAEVAIIMAGLTDEYESEGFDRKHLRLPKNHNALIDAISKVHDKVVVILCNGAPVEMPWIDEVDSVIEMYLGGQAGGAAIWDIVTGRVSPSGKLAETFPRHMEDCSAHKNFANDPYYVDYKESIYVGYRYYDKLSRRLLFPFGHGLSYNTYEYSNISVNNKVINDDEMLEVTLKVTNQGNYYGKEIVQLYVADKESTIFRPIKELKAFCKVTIEPKETEIVKFILDKRAFAYYNVEEADWIVESGDFEILVGASSADIRLKEKVTVNSTSSFDESKNDSKKTLNHYYDLPFPFDTSNEEFFELLGREVDYSAYIQTEFTRNSTFDEIRVNFIGKRVYNRMTKEMRDRLSDNPKQARMMESVLKEMPIRNLIAFQGEKKFDYKLIDGLVQMLNGQPIRGLLKMRQK